jgi:hypothetical protein
MGGGYILGGKTQPGTGFLRRVTATGENVWRQNYYGSGFTFILGITQTADSGFAFTGFNYSFPEGYLFYLEKTTLQGDSLWSNTFGISTFEALADLKSTRDHGFILAGYHADSGRAVAVRTDSLGNQLWMQTFRRNSPASFQSVLQTDDGGYLFGGMSGNDAYAVRFGQELNPPSAVTAYPSGDNIVLRWIGNGSPWYSIYSSPSAQGPFTTFEGSTASTSHALPIAPGDESKFFVVVGSTTGR